MSVHAPQTSSLPSSVSMLGTQFTMDRRTETKRLITCPVQAVDCRTARTFQSRTRHAPNGSQGMQNFASLGE